MRKLVVFDLDGTLVDSITDVALCFDRALTEEGFPAPGVPGVLEAVGGNLEQVVSKLLPETLRTSANIDAVKHRYRRLYLESDKPNTSPYPGIRELIRDLRGLGVKVAVNTNKGQALSDELVGRLFTDHPFEAVVGYDERFPSKPDPHGVRRILARCGLAADDAVYVGDGKSDIETARAAGMDLLLVTWGQATPEDLATVPADRRVADADAILRFVRGDRT